MFEVDQTVYETPRKKKKERSPPAPLPPGTPTFSLTKPPPLYSGPPVPGRRVSEGGGRDTRKKSFYVPADMMRELKMEADRQGRSLSWLLKKAWEIARPTLAKFPDDPGGK